MAEYPNFVGPAYRLLSINAAGDRCVNLYPQTIQSGTGKGKMSLEPTPGLQLFATLPKSPCRGLWAGDNRLFAVGDDTLYEIDGAGSVTSIGAMNSAATPATIIPNGVGTQLLICSGSQIWVSNGGAPARPSYGTLSGLVNTSGTTVTYGSGDKFTATMVGTSITINGVTYTVATFINEDTITLTTSAGAQTLVAYSWTEFVNGVAAAYLGGYYCVLSPNSNTINISDLNNGLTWDALDYQQRISRPDRLQMIYTVGEQLWLFGQDSSEAWYLTGEDFPLSRVQGSLVDYGIWAPFSVASVGDNSFMFLSGSTSRGFGSVKLVNGFKFTTVSTYAIEYAIRSYATSSDAVAYSYTSMGHTFYVLNFPTANKTWVYDVGENAWHERAYLNGSTLQGQLQRFACNVYEENIVGSGTTGKLYQMRYDVYTDDTVTIRRLRQAPHLSNEQKWLFYRYFQLDCDMGDVPSSGSGSSPNISLSISNDGGKTFGTSIPIPLGTTGEFTKRAKWNRLGRSRDRVFQVVCDEPILISWVNAYLGVDDGTGT
jgi:hypothetical protein